MAGVSKSIGGSALVLWLYATVAGLLTVGIYLYTKDTITEQRRMAQARALTQIIDDRLYDNELLDAVIALPNPADLGQSQSAQAYIARKGGAVAAVILPVIVSDGYGGDMNMIVGVKTNGEITGVRVLSHNETPGLGDRIDVRKSAWIHSFAERSLANPERGKWKVKKDGGVFDQFTGATITPRAVVKGVYNSLLYYEKHREQLSIPLPQMTPVAGNTGNNRGAQP